VAVPLGLLKSKRASLDLPSISPRQPKKSFKQLNAKTPNPQNPYHFEPKQNHYNDRMKQVLQLADLQDSSLKHSNAERKPNTLRKKFPVVLNE
jgi:hypothetical protein